MWTCSKRVDEVICKRVALMHGIMHSTIRVVYTDVSGSNRQLSSSPRPPPPPRRDWPFQLAGQSTCPAGIST